MKDLTEKQKRAASWLDGRKWKLEESRSLADAGYEELTLTLNETADACPRDMLAAVVRAIEAAESGVGQTALEVEGAVHDGTWLLKRVDWRREGDGRNPPQDNRLQLYKRYVRVTDKNPAAHVMENNCFWVVTHMFRFNMAAIEAVPAGSSGVTYAIRGASADKETRLWDYVVEKREQLTTTTGVIVVEDDKFQTVWQQGWYGVRAGNKTDTGAAAALWNPAAQPAGTVVTTPFIQKNDNCTTDIIQRKTTAKAVTGAKRSEERTLYEITTDRTDSGQAAAAAAGVEAANGKVTRRWADQKTDGTWDNREKTEQERAVTGAERTVTRDAFSETVENEDTGQPLPGDENEVAAVGETLQVQNKRTPGGLWNVLKRRVRAVFVAVAEERHSRDMFEDTDEIRRKAASAPLGTPPAAGGGVWREWRDTLRPDRKRDQHEVLHRERKLALSVREHTADALGYSEMTESVDAAALADPGVAAPAAGTQIRRRSELTRGGLWRRRETVDHERELALAVREHTADALGYSEMIESVDAAALADPGVAAPAAGTQIRRRSELTRGGLWRRRETVDHERDIARTFKSGEDYFGTAETETGVADSVELEIAAGQSGSASASLTPGGKLRYSKQVETAKTAQRWVLLDQESKYSNYGELAGDMAGKVSDAVKAILYANADLTTAQADAAQFVAKYKPFVVIVTVPYFGNETTQRVYFHYQHQISFGLHVNRQGRWDGTLTMRAALTEGLQYTSVAAAE